MYNKYNKIWSKKKRLQTYFVATVNVIFYFLAVSGKSTAWNKFE